jgi:hypothetical protein
MRAYHDADVRQGQLQRVNALLPSAEPRGGTIDLVDHEPLGADRKQPKHTNKSVFGSGASRDNKPLCLVGYMIVFENLPWRLALYKFQRQDPASLRVPLRRQAESTRRCFLDTLLPKSRTLIAFHFQHSTGRLDSALDVESSFFVDRDLQSS